MEERLQKYMARCGIDSRRKCEELIAQGQVEVNGEVVREPGVKVDPMQDRIRVNGKKLHVERPAYYVHYKVKGVTTTVSDDLGRRTVMDCLPNIRERVYPVGRLDKESEGLLVLTNDGALANYLTHPAHGVEKTYRVVAEGRIDREVLETLSEKGMRLGPVLVKPSRVELVRYDNDNTVVLIAVSEGINREVRRIFAALGHEVKRLLRVQVGPVKLESLKRGATRPFSAKELSVLKKGMEGMDTSEEAEMFPSGSARGRKPTGPRGRPSRTRAPRQGKPDPAADRNRRGKGDVVEDDWKKTVTVGRRGRGVKTADAKPAKTKTFGPAKPGGKGNRETAENKPRKPLRPVRSAAKTQEKPAPRPKAPAKKTVRPKMVAHPLAGRRGSEDKKNG